MQLHGLTVVKATSVGTADVGDSQAGPVIGDTSKNFRRGVMLFAKNVYTIGQYQLQVMTPSIFTIQKGCGAAINEMVCSARW